MPYQVLARKWRPQRFDEVVGQRGVTDTLRNAITSGRLAQAFVFAGPRGVGKTTTARILARALNCTKGPTPDPCGHCESCIEIAAGRSIDVLEIDAATHTQVENVREVIIAGLAMAPVRDRYKIFIIDEFHQLSSHSFNALLKSIEEPPPHITFVMATTQLEKIPETILSRSQVFDFRTIGAKPIAGQLRMIASAEEIAIDEAAVALIARAADGSMRDAQSAFDQVIAFAGKKITASEVSTVLGLIGRELVFDVVDAVANEDAPAIFSLSARFVEAGYDLRLVCRELSRVVRDLLVVSVDTTRLEDPEISAETERERLGTMAKRFSREDLMRAFDVLARAELEIRTALQPRYNLEMALLRWMHLRQLVPLTELMKRLQIDRPIAEALTSGRQTKVKNKKSPDVVVKSKKSSDAVSAVSQKKSNIEEKIEFKAAVLAEVKRQKKFFHGTVIAQAQKIDIDDNRLIFTFSSAHQTLARQLEQHRSWLEELACKITGQKIVVVIAKGLASNTPEPSETESETSGKTLKAKAMTDGALQAMLDVFPVEIKDVREAED